ncbi:MBL fold hydrolase [Syntrophotalea acetylenivorans]|uniref:MBL fold hydrolase n=1 Tax=Syntrophotalea acetylenivorans TaxID=1842532 RepID=A0A1L3GKI2_9BACT|nr:MBL fold metallo-hydrolase [Syntrophotalea acetylenivorans]APG26457.1 MBL fold hydrolase [Syntrophotalea acetylenivorans]
MSNTYPQILHHGALQGVTGSCHELRLSGKSGILIDCGLFQGEEAEGQGARSKGQGLRGDNESWQTIEFPIEHIKALVVSHVHIDHVGRIPYLLAAGFEGPIYCSEPSALLLPLVLEDAVKVGFTRDSRLVERFLKRLQKMIVPLPYGRWQKIETDSDVRLDIKLQPAGHILGSVYVECRVRSLSEDSGHLPVTNEHNLAATNRQCELRYIFSGDLGAPYAPLLPAPRSPYRADVLVLEATYGDRLHEGRRERRQKLRRLIEGALQDRGVVLVPAFSIGRTQELLYELEEIIHRQGNRTTPASLPWDELEIIVDSPLASRFTEAYRALRPYWDAEARRKVRSGRHPLSFEQLTTIDSHTDHQQAVAYLQKTGRPCVVIAASGMCSGGRIVNYLKALIGDRRTDVLFVGYQAAGTPGRDIQVYGPRGGYVVLDGKRYPIRARIHTIGDYSAHADQQNLINFVRRMRHRPHTVRLVHGDAEAKRALAAKLKQVIPGLLVDIP